MRVGFLVIITICITPALFEKGKIVIAKSVNEGDSKVSYIPTAIRFLVEIFSDKLHRNYGYLRYHFALNLMDPLSFSNRSFPMPKSESNCSQRYKMIVIQKKALMY